MLLLTLEKFKECLIEIYQTAHIKKIAFTGGEPTLYPELILQLISIIDEIDANIVVDVNTNGFGLNALDTKTLSRFGQISLSRHHWDDERNAKSLGLAATQFTLSDIQRFPIRDSLHLRCNLIKGFVDSRESVLHYMNEMRTLGVYDFGFIGLMPLNDFCKESVVTPESIGLDRPYPGAFPTKSWDKPSGSCHCRNYIIDLGTGIPVKYYTRYETAPESCVDSVLVYDVNVLRHGFGGRIIH